MNNRGFKHFTFTIFLQFNFQIRYSPKKPYMGGGGLLVVDCVHNIMHLE
jgi:hypothetical protein